MTKIKFNNYPTPIQYYDRFNNNYIYIKRDDLTEPTLGGNKVRKLELLLEEAREIEADYIITYGSAQSNHCRLTVSMARKLGFNVLLILAKADKVNFNGNYLIYDLYDTEIVWTDPNEVDRKSTRLNSSHVSISYAVFCLKKKKKIITSSSSIT